MPKQAQVYTYEDISSTHMKLWRLLSILPFEGQTLSYIISRLLLFNFQIMNFIYNTMHIGYGVRMIVNKNFEIDYVCEMVMVQSLSLRYVFFCLKHKNFEYLMHLCKKLWKHMTPEETKIVKGFEKKVHYYRNFFFWNSVSVVTMFLLTSQLIKLQSSAVNGTETRILPFRFYTDVQEEPYFTTVSIFQGVVCYYVAVILTGIETIGPFLIMIACGYLRTIKERLLSMTKVQENEVLSDCKVSQAKNIDRLSIEDLTRCVRLHQDVLEFCKEIERFMQSFFMIMIFCTVYNLSLIVLQLLENDEYFYKYLSLLGLNFLQLYICQWGPEQLLIESEAVANAAYFATLVHPQFDVRSNQILLLIITRAQRPIQLTAGGYVKLSMETFGKMMKSAFSFLTMIRSFDN